MTRDNAERSRVELKARGVDPDRPDDRTTGPEWLALHRAEQAEREQDQPVTELDVAEHLSEERPAELDEPAETAVPDVREVSTPDPTEAADPTERRRVRPVDETTLAVQRAQESLAEIGQRQAADTARAEADTAEREAIEAARRAELSRWSADTADADSSGEENVLARET
ncbi:MAG: hypothetical protein ACRDRH_10380 [Pseudonocardia sp.]